MLIIDKWYNYKTGKYEPHTKMPQDLRDYIPQSTAAQRLYALLIDQFKYSPLKAIERVLSAVVGQKWQAQEEEDNAQP